MISFDVKSLFTNVPLDETIEIILQKVYVEMVMGSPLGPLLANIVMISLEEKFFLKCLIIYVIGNVKLMTLMRMLFLKRLILF